MFSWLESSLAHEDIHEGLYDETNSVFLFTILPLDLNTSSYFHEEEGRQPLLYLFEENVELSI